MSVLHQSSSSNAARRRKAAAAKAAAERANRLELPFNCGEIKSDHKKDNALAGIGIGIGCAFIIILILIGMIMNDRLNRDERYMYFGAIFCLLGAIGGMGYAIHKVIVEDKKRLQRAWPILESEKLTCNYFFSVKYPSGTPTKVPETGATPIVFPANKAITKLQVDVDDTSKFVLQVKRTMADGTVTAAAIPGAVFDTIKGGKQCVYDVLLTSDVYSIELITNDAECEVTYTAVDIPTSLTDYLKKYRIIGRKCSNTTLTVDEAHKVVSEVTTYCE